MSLPEYRPFTSGLQPGGSEIGPRRYAGRQMTRRGITREVLPMRILSGALAVLASGTMMMTAPQASAQALEPRPRSLELGGVRGRHGVFQAGRADRLEAAGRPEDPGGPRQAAAVIRAQARLARWSIPAVARPSSPYGAMPSVVSELTSWFDVVLIDPGAWATGAVPRS